MSNRTATNKDPCDTHTHTEPNNSEFTHPSLLLHHLVKVSLWVLVIDEGNLELIDEDSGDFGGEESGKNGTETDVLNSETEKGQQHGNGLLLHPGKGDRQR